MMIKVKRTIAYLFLLVIILYVITGYGITKYQLVEGLTLGILDKATSFKIHHYLIYPLIILAISHIYFAFHHPEDSKRKKRKRK